MSGFVHVHLGPVASCSFDVKSVLEKPISVIYRVEFSKKVYGDLGLREGMKFGEVLNVLSERGLHSVALPTVTVRFVLFDENGDKYTATFLVFTMDYYALGFPPHEALKKTLENPFETFNRRVVIEVVRDYLISQLTAVPRVADVVYGQQVYGNPGTQLSRTLHGDQGMVVMATSDSLEVPEWFKYKVHVETDGSVNVWTGYTRLYGVNT